jgi:hypothetical protein
VTGWQSRYVVPRQRQLVAYHSVKDYEQVRTWISWGGICTHDGDELALGLSKEDGLNGPGRVPHHAVPSCLSRYAR